MKVYIKEYMFITMKMLQIRSGLDKLFQIGFHWFLRNKLTIELFNQCFQCTLHIEKKLYCNHQNKLMIEPFHQCIWYTLIKKKPCSSGGLIIWDNGYRTLTSCTLACTPPASDGSPAHAPHGSAPLSPPPSSLSATSVPTKSHSSSWDASLSHW